MKRLFLLLLIAFPTTAQMSLLNFGFARANAFDNCGMSAAGHRCYGAFVTDRPLYVSGVQFRIGSVTTGDTLRVSLQTTDLQFPTGTMLTSTTLSVGTANANSFVTANFPTTVTLDMGVRYAVVFEFASYSGGNLNVTISQTNLDGVGAPGASTLIMAGRYDGSSWSRHPHTSSLYLVLLNEFGRPHQMYWSPQNTSAAAPSNTTVTAVCTAQFPMWIRGLLAHRSSGGASSNYHTFSISVNGTQAWSQQFSYLAGATYTFVIVPVSPPVYVPHGATVAFSVSSTGVIPIVSMSDVQYGSVTLRETASAGLACRPASGTFLPLISPFIQIANTWEEDIVSW